MPRGSLAKNRYTPPVRLGAVVVAAVILWPPGAEGQALDCDRPDPGLCEITPTPPPRLGECAVEPIPRNAPIKVRLTDGFLQDLGLEGVLVSASHAATGEPTPGALMEAGPDLVFFTPDAPWDALTQYDVRVQAGLDEIDLCFDTSAIFDTEPPRLGRILEVTPRPDSVAADLEEGALRVDVEFEAATDDGPLGSLEYFIYLTRGWGVDAPMLLWRARHQTEVVAAGLALPAEQTVAPACLVVVAMDGVGHTDATDPRCFEPLQGNFFEPLCSVGSMGGAGGAAGMVGPLAVALIVARRRRRARRSPGGSR
jgi:MYXO-CTERM domain-containing protein